MNPQSLRNPKAEAAAAKPSADDPFPALLAEWEAGHAALSEAKLEAAKKGDGLLSDRQFDELHDPIQAVENKIIDTPTRTIAGVVAKLRVMVKLVKEFEASETFVATALAGAEYIMRELGVVAEDKAVATAASITDPIVELAREHRTAIDRHNKLPDDDDADDLLTDVIMPLEDKLARKRPTTREGIIAALDVAAREERKHHGDAPGGTEAMVVGVIENARDALRAGVGMAEDAGPDPLVAMWSEWDKLRKTRFSDHVPHGDPIDLKAEEAFYDGKVDEMTEIEDRIMAAVPSTLAGALVQMSVLIDRTVTDIAPPQKDIDAAVASLAAAQGGAS